MTTVAYKNGVMACDSCWSLGYSVDTLSPKITRLKSGALLGQAGSNDARDVIALLQNVKSFAGMPSYKTLAELRLDFLGLLVLPRGRILKVATTMISPENWDADMHDDLGVWSIDMPFAAVGTGTEIAIGAMAAGANVVAAVRIAARYDMNSRLPVHSLPLKPGGKV